MSRAFVNEDAGTPSSSRRFVLPARDDPGFNAAAAEALLEAARDGDTSSAERATGYYWGEPALREEVQRIMARAQKSGDDRLEQLARRFLR
jgi:predicted NodU family carbamoyl transferase